LVVNDGLADSAPDTVTITAVLPDAITLSPDALDLLTRDSATVTITLNNPAGEGGLTVALESDNTAVVSVPASVTIPEGQTSATFEITTGTTAGAATITASAPDSEGDAITVNVALRTMSVGLAPNPIGIGDQSVVTITLAQPAPSGGVNVTLESSDTGVAQVTIAEVFISEGGVSGKSAVSGVAAGEADITASADGYQDAAATLTVLPTDTTPPQVVSVSPANGSINPTNSVSSVSVTFNESMNAATLTSETLKLFSAGDDGVIGNEDDAQLAGVVSYDDATFTARLTLSQALGPGDYQGFLSGSVTDLLGNALGADLTWTFTVKEPKLWDGGGDGTSWHDPLNWQDDTLPGASDVVVIDIEGDVTITHSTGSTTIHSLFSEEAIVLSGGTLSIAASSEINNDFAMSGGTLAGNGAVRVSGDFSWTGGQMNGPGKTIVDGALTMTGTADKNVRFGRTLEVNGVASWDNGALRFNEASAINVAEGASFDVVGDRFVDWQFGVQPSINNAGTMRKTAGTGNFDVESIFNNSGVFEVQSGILLLDGGGTSSGDFIVPVGSTLRFDSNHTLTADSSVSGGGTTHFTSGAVSVNGGYTVTGATEIAGGDVVFNSNVSLPVLTLSSGELRGTGEVTVTGLFDWTGGEMRDSGKTIVDGLLTMGGASDKNMRFARTLEINNIATWDNGALRFNEASAINVAEGASFDVVGDRFVDWQFGAQPTINNAGTMRKTTGAGSFTIESFFNNSGAFEIQ
ncbi:MAG: Ig-like domain-containing protein, partial [Chloroflexi bacterium]|nr:Ig-like domain-containing protein [Chloroflexota bacterium]